MPDLDLDPKDYRAKPLAGERVFAFGGLTRLAIVGGMVAVVLLLNVLLRPHLDTAWDWFWGLWG